MITVNHIWNCIEREEEGNFGDEKKMSNVSIQNKFEIEVEKMINGVIYVDDRYGSNAKKQLCRQRLFFNERYQESHATIFSKI